MFHLQTITQAYWTSEFEVTPDDLEFLYNVFLEDETPLKTPDLIQRLIEHRIENEFRQLKKFQATGDIFQPSKTYEIGQEIMFPAFDFKSGKVISKRAGENSTYGAFEVLTVEFEDQITREFASQLTVDHKLNQDISTIFNVDRPSASAIYEKYKRTLTPLVVDTLREDKDTLFIAKRWFLKSLLLEVNVGHLNLAEAVLDLEAGGPVDTSQIAGIIGVGAGDNPILQSVSLDYALSKDDRFDEVGPAGKVLWFLRRMEPAEILQPPALLRYTETPYNAAALSDDMMEIEEQIDDELSLIELEEDEELEEEGSIVLTYPHWRAGTIPLTPRVEHLFPIAYRTPRILITLIDAQTQEEIRGWVVRDYGYVYGLGDFYQRYELPIGAYITIHPDPKDNSRIFIDFHRRKARNEWLYLATVKSDGLHFAESQQPVGAEFDELMLIGVEDPAALDKLGERYQRNPNLAPLITDIMREMAVLSPQQHVHCKTLYSAVNLVKRCPPGPIFATLQTHPAFLHTGGPYWQLIS